MAKIRSFQNLRGQNITRGTAAALWKQPFFGKEKCLVEPEYCQISLDELRTYCDCGKSNEYCVGKFCSVYVEFE